MDSSKSRQAKNYIIYAVGEIFLVMVGILLALQVNNWNNERKDRNIEQNLFQNLLVNLETDSIALARISNFMDRSLKAQSYIMITTTDQIRREKSDEELNQLLKDLWNGIYSFFPKTGIYQQILNNNHMEIIRSPKIKEAIVEYYDYKCQRYTLTDQVVEQKFQFGITEFFASKLKITNSGPSEFDSRHLFDHLEGLRTECRNIYDVCYAMFALLHGISEDCEQIMKMLRSEIQQ